MTTAKEYIQNTFELVKARNAHEAEFLQAVEEFLNTLEPVFEKLLAFVEQYPAIRKGLYLYGDFGVGKSFMVAALAHDLSEKRGVSSTLLHHR